MKGLEALEKLFYQVPLTPHNMFENGELANIIKKELKAIEIFKKYMKITEDSKGETLVFKNWDYQTKEEINLLKEVLKNGN